MNKKLTWIIVAAIVAIGAGAIYYFFVKDRNQHLRYIPKDASLAIHCDLKSLRDKSDFEKVKKMKFFTRIMDEYTRYGSNHDFTDVLFKKPFSTGIDLLSQPVVFMTTRNDKMFMGLCIKLTSSGDFNRWMKKYKTSEEPKKNETYTCLDLDDAGAMVAWNDEAALFLSGPNFRGSSSGKAETEKVLDIYMTQDKKESLSENENYQKFRNTDQDIGVFLTYDKLFEFYGNVFKSRMYYSQDMMDSKAQMEKLKEKFKGVCAGLSVSFENTGITGKMETYGDNMSKLMEEAGFTGKAISDDMIKSISDEQVYGTLFLNYNFSKMLGYQIENNPMYKDGIQKIADKLGMSINDMKGLLGGEIAFSFVGAEIVKTEKKIEDIDPVTDELITKTQTEESPMPYFTLSFDVKNFNAIPKIVDSLNMIMNHPEPEPDVITFGNDYGSSYRDYNRPSYSPYSDDYLTPLNVKTKPKKEPRTIEKQGDNYYIKIEDVEIFIVKTSFGYTATNSKKIADALQKSKSLNGDPKLIGKDYFTSNSMGFKMVLDPEKYPKPIIEYLKNHAMRDDKFWKMMKNFKDFSMQVPVDKTTEADFSINLNEGKGNSLYRLLEIIDESI